MVSLPPSTALPLRESLLFAVYLLESGSCSASGINLFCNGVIAVGSFPFLHPHHSLKHRPCHRKSKATIPSKATTVFCSLPSALDLLYVDTLNRDPRFRALCLLPVWVQAVLFAYPLDTPRHLSFLCVGSSSVSGGCSRESVRDLPGHSRGVSGSGTRLEGKA